MSFTQTLTVRTDARQELIDLLGGWHRDQQGVAPGYEGARVLADEAQPGRFVIEVDFTNEGAARENDERPETKAWADELRSLADGDPEYRDFTLAYATG